MSPVFSSLGMKLAQTGVAKEWAVKVSFVKSLTAADHGIVPLIGLGQRGYKLTCGIPTEAFHAHVYNQYYVGRLYKDN